MMVSKLKLKLQCLKLQGSRSSTQTVAAGQREEQVDMLAVRHGDDEIAMESNSATCAVHLQIFATGRVRVLVASYVVVGARDRVRGAILRVALRGEN